MTTLVPRLFAELRKIGVHDLTIAGWLKKTRTAIRTLPTEWDGIV